jgi:hypothetical protein
MSRTNYPICMPFHSRVDLNVNTLLGYVLCAADGGQLKWQCIPGNLLYVCLVFGEPVRHAADPVHVAAGTLHACLPCPLSVS